MLHGMNERRIAHRGLERRTASSTSTTTDSQESSLTDAETTLTIRISTSDSVTSTSATSSAKTSTSTHTSSTSMSSTSTTTTSITSSTLSLSTTSLSTTSSSSSSSSSYFSTSSTVSAEATSSSTHTTAISVTVSAAAKSVSTSDVASASASSTSGTSHTGAIIGGLAAGIIGLALVIATVGFFLRRWRTNRRETDEFDAKTFRRSAVLMHGPRSDPDTDRSFNPRPPSMLERRNHPMSFGTQYGAPGPAYAPPERSQPHYGAGVTLGYSLAANSANPLFAPAVHKQVDDTPSAFPVPSDTPQYVYSYDLDDGPLPSPVYGLGGPTIPARTPSNRTSENTVSRNVSISRSTATYDQSVHHSSVASSAPWQSLPVPANDYIDVARSSVTPFQAAQYAEIANRLDTEVPQGLDTPAVNEYVHSRNASLATNGSGTPPVVPPKDSYNTQATSAPSPSPKRTSVQSQASVDIMKDLEFPAPPSPVLSTSSRYRVDSTPPTLPEISIDRGSVSQYSLPSSYRDSTSSTPMSSPFTGSGSGFPSGVSQTITVAGKLSTQSRFPTTPSPLGSSFVMTPPAERKNGFPSSPTPSSPTIPAVKRPETIYHADDAYGGI
ncbi:uncharacterized protein BT62DRAFT_1007510 [Guyanagaster necrorhizus]|uniref:Uncharacterized protein n=1 Tax=Guyanagaster necrorhizus TaxID=856835 RepID=A0A9P7VQU4_9AGAR|nr:uncharacterized protein BT62DRAFT_1007510 [Guyanagaster necrorhizus MCA 3950]KAG7445127.1 hypothetical protein BT62DRAFT_1007510 [Guyanagaster necrorhizus MCA 3950]